MIIVRSKNIFFNLLADSNQRVQKHEVRNSTFLNYQWNFKSKLPM